MESARDLSSIYLAHVQVYTGDDEALVLTAHTFPGASHILQGLI